MALNNNFKTNISDAVTSLTSAQKMEFANVIFASSFDISSFNTKHTIITDVRNGNKIPIISSGNDYGALSASTGDCTTNTCSLDANYSNKEWKIGDYDCRVEICLKTFEEDFLLFWGMYRQNLDNPLTEPDKKAFFAYVEQLSNRKIQGALWRAGYWGDVTSANALISKNNGVWTEADAGDGIKRELPKMPTLSGKQIYDELSASYQVATSTTWFDESKTFIRMSYKMASALVAFFNGLSDTSMYNCDCLDPNKVVNSRVFSIQNLRMFGLPVVVDKEVDDSGNAVGKTPDYRALFINKDNLLFGVNTTKHLAQFDMDYDKVRKVVYIDLGIQIGVSIPLDDEYLLITQATA